MSCNWELLELRVVIWTKAIKSPFRGYAGQGVMFYGVFPDIQSLGIGSFQGQNNSCNFRQVFSELVKLKKIPFNCSKNDKYNQSSFLRIQTAEHNNELLPGAKLYVHRRNQSDLASKTTGEGIVLDNVKISLTTAAQKSYYIYLLGDSASLVN
ncbi:MAG: hypothetical protein R3F37_19550 [Candidatus Competibacteraceae bacterium]